MHFSSSVRQAQNQLARIWNSMPLLTLHQGSTLHIIGSRHVKLNVRIVPQVWREDTLLTLNQIFPVENNPASGRDDEVHMSAELSKKTDTSNTTVATVNVGLKRLMMPSKHEKKHSEDAATREISQFPERSYGLGNPRNEEYDGTYLSARRSCNDNDEHINEFLSSKPSEPMVMLTANIPQKMNIICQLEGQGSAICMEGKVEGESFDLSTALGHITISKLRGHKIDIHAGGGGSIHVKQLLEAQNINLSATSSEGANENYGRIRAKQIHAHNLHATVGSSTATSTANEEAWEDHPYDASLVLEGNNTTKLDLDDSLARIDIGSLYTSSANAEDGGAFIGVNAPGGTIEHPRNVRIKSSHGHVSVYTVLSSFANKTFDEYRQENSLVELGGINGHCDVIVSLSDDDDDVNNDDSDAAELNGATRTARTTAIKAHFDSVGSNEISAITTERGDVKVTFDRKVEADMRLFSARDLSPVDFNELISSDLKALSQTLKDWDRDLEQDISTADVDQENEKKIAVHTDSFVVFDDEPPVLQNVNVVMGTLLRNNKDEDPDSRFDVRTNNKRGGKIDMNSAQNQALNRFVGGKDDNTNRHLLVVASTGHINIESMSWFGAIARRYGLEEKTLPIQPNSRAYNINKTQ